MQELSIAMSIVESAAEEITWLGQTRVKLVHDKVGPVSLVDKDALLFSYGIAADGTACEGSQLLIEDVPVLVFCQRCDAQRSIESIQRFCCSVCGALTNEVVQGRELRFVAMEVEGYECSAIN